uniref:Uncharacterized protein n=1 Tax=Anguilla anguilla TaxID=7936 RepID=A0A0E9XD37_ANGAN
MVQCNDNKGIYSILCCIGKLHCNHIRYIILPCGIV